MDVLIRFELRKIIRKKTFLFGVLILLGAAVFLSMILISNERITGKDGKFLHGIAAIQLQKEYNRQLSGSLTVDKIVDAVKWQHFIKHDPNNLDGKGEITIEANAKNLVKYEQIYTLVSSAFSPVGDYDFYVIDNMEPSEAKVFYQKRLEKVNDYLQQDDSFNYSEEEKEFFIKMNEKISVPFKIAHVNGWENVFENQQSLFLIISFVIAICLAPVFAGEYQSGADSIILSSRYGRNKLIFAKLIAALIITLLFYAIAVLTYTLILLAICGFDGRNASIQIIELLAPVPYSVFQTYLWTVFIGGMACLLMSVITLWLSSRLRGPFQVIIASGIILVGPLLIPIQQNSRILHNLLGLFPGYMFDVYNKITQYEAIRIFGLFFLEYKFMIISSIFMISLMLPDLYRVFRKHQVI